jgi:RES domain-containing protein
MQVFRIAKTPYINDLTGIGPRIYGGRWNYKGTSLIYTSETRALATLENLVHVPLSIVPAGYSIAIIKIPDSASIHHIAQSKLPKNWMTYPAQTTLGKLGTKWANERKTLLLKVPSAIVEQEYNILINPLHAEMKLVKILKVAEYKFDDRLSK